MRNPTGFTPEEVADELRKGPQRLKWASDIDDRDLRECAKQLGQILHAQVKFERVPGSRTMAFFHVVKKRKKGGKQ